MTNIGDWEQRPEFELAEIRRGIQSVSDAMAGLRGRCDAFGVTVEVDIRGVITDLEIAPSAMQRSSAQLPTVLLDCHEKALEEATAKAEKLWQGVDLRARDVVKGQAGERQRAYISGAPTITEKEEIQSADDEYFERMNRQGWLR
ncbi:hypothetical protein ACQP1G_16535 [Nocardia sp. CA-107356]|uniref:hypothetical protein n=1 Tax=Nocardia sp. CA-107356 TaxID=3239972 RepID=UPI003D9134F3